jgi:hypothetical protein
MSVDDTPRQAVDIAADGRNNEINSLLKQDVGTRLP